MDADAEVIAPDGVEAPVLEPAQGPLVQEVEHHANVDPDQAVLDAALGAAEDDEFLRGDESDEEAEAPIPVTEDHKAAASSKLTVRRFHSDRDREFNNAKLRDYLAARGIHNTVAFLDEPQSTGRAESTIRRIKATTRTVLQEHDAGPGEWALAAKYATHCLRVRAFKTLVLKTKNGSLLTTGKLWQLAVKPKIEN